MAAAKTRRRVALLGLFHETNTFSAIPASYDAFNTSRGAALLPPDGGQSVIAGYGGRGNGPRGGARAADAR